MSYSQTPSKMATPSKPAFPKRLYRNGYSAQKTSKSSDDLSMLEKLNKLSRNLSNAPSGRNSNDKISKLLMPTASNITEFLACLAGEQSDAKMANNIYLQALLLPYLDFKKEKKNEHAIQFRSNGDKIFAKMPKAFNCNTVMKVLRGFDVTDKKQPAIIKMLKKGVTETKKELSALCFAIVLASIQDRKSFKSIKKMMKGVIKSELLHAIHLSDDYLAELRGLLKQHIYRPAFANCLVETLAAYNTKQLNKKCALNRQLALARMVKRLFYLKKSEIMVFMDEVVHRLDGNLYALSMDLLLDKESYSEITKWYPTFWQISMRCNPIKRRIALAYESLTSDDAKAGHKLVDNTSTVSFFLGALANSAEFMNLYKDSFDRDPLDSRYYSLGALLRNYLLIAQLESQLKFVHANQLNLTDEFLAKCLAPLQNEIQRADGAQGDSNLYQQGLQAFWAQPTFIKGGKRDTLREVVDFAAKLKRIRNEKNLQARQVLVANLRLKSHFEEIKQYDEPMVNNVQVELMQLELQFAMESRNETKCSAASIKSEREVPVRAANEEVLSVERPSVIKRETMIDVENEREVLVKDEEMEVVFDDPADQADHRRVPLGNLNNRYSLSQATKSQNSQNSQDSDCIAMD